MQFKIFALVLAAMASVASAGETVTVYACSASAATKATSAAVGTGTAASTGVVTAPTSTGSPIAYATGAANINGASFGMLVAGGAAALFL